MQAPARAGCLLNPRTGPTRPSGTIARMDLRPGIRLLPLTPLLLVIACGGELGVFGSSGHASLVSISSFDTGDVDETRAIAWADWDGDGDLDLATGTSGGHFRNRLYENADGDLTLIWSSQEEEASRGLAWGDWDGDGDLDLAVANSGATFNGQVNRVYDNDGGTLTPSWESPETDTSHSVAWGDYDDDGDLDLAVGNMGLSMAGEPNRLYENTGGDLTLAWWTSESEDTRDVAWGDWDGDGDLDLAVANRAAADPLRVYENDAGVFGNASTGWAATEVDETLALAWGDVDADGDMDLVTGAIDQPQTRLYANTGGLSSYWQADKGGAVNAVDLGDWNRDGLLDLAGAVSTGVQEFVHDGDGVSFVTAPWTSGETANAMDITWVDRDDDGDLDLFAGVSGAANIGWNNSGVSLLSTEVPNAVLATSLAWGDVDQDGDLDLAAAQGSAAGVRIFVNVDGTLDGTFLTVPGTTSGQDVAWGDWNGDGYLELAVARAGAVNKVFAGVPGGLELAGPAWLEDAASMAASYAVAWGDVDGDGDLDLAFGNGNNEPVQVYTNTGGGLEALPGWDSDYYGPDCRDIAWGDWDGDGDLDLAASNREGLNFIFVNDGSGMVTTSTLATGQGEETWAIDWGDWDGDGDLDLLTANGVDSQSSDEPNRIYSRNDFNDAMVAGYAFPTYDNGHAARFFDVEGDGDLDVFVGNHAEADRLWVNDGDGVLTIAWASFYETDNTNHIEPGDFDGDGDIDLAVSYDGTPLRLYVNHRISEPVLPNNPTYPVVGMPGTSAAATSDFFAGIAIDGPEVSIPFWLYDEESDSAPEVTLEYAEVPGAWQPATLAASSPPATDLAASPTGFAHSLDWDRAADGASGDGLRVRLSVEWQNPTRVAWPIQQGRVSAESPSFAAGCTADGDGDGFDCDADCDDLDPLVNPDAVEVPDNAVDDDCSGADAVTCYADLDNDGYGWNIGDVSDAGDCSEYSNQAPLSGDCWESDDTIYPGAPELCDGLDNDCDGTVPADETDDDGDGVSECDGDCDDTWPLIYSGADEICDGQDNDCDGSIAAEELDDDGDGVRICDPIGDCDDADNENFPGNIESCDGQDNDCDGLDDAGNDGQDGWETDNDGDGQSECDSDCDDADPNNYAGNIESCEPGDNDCNAAPDIGEYDNDGDGETGCDGDCDDADAAIHSGGADVPDDGIDQDCSGADSITCYGDSDGDGHGDYQTSTVSYAGDCSDLASFVTDYTDCDDDDPDNYPGNTEVCDGADNDCNGLDDYGDPGVGGQEEDGDSDGESICQGDCDDGDATVSTAAVEICDGADNDCDGVLPSTETDDDGDGQAECDGDCDDSDPVVYAGAPELCDGVDTDCNGTVESPDDQEGLDFVLWFNDGDGDGFGNPGGPWPDNPDCTQPQPGYVANSDDCVDDDAAIHPGADEVCDGIDNDCDSATLPGGADEDVDGDGVWACDETPDCDDANVDAFPGNDETCGDGVDNDCDGAEDPDLGMDDPECWETSCMGCSSSVGGGRGGAALMILVVLLPLLRRRRTRALPALVLVALLPALAMAGPAEDVRAALEQGDCATARAITSQLTEQAPDQAEGWQLAGDAARCASDTRAAVLAYRRYLALAGEDAAVQGLVDALAATLATARVRLALPEEADRVEVTLELPDQLLEHSSREGDAWTFGDLPVGVEGTLHVAGMGLAAFSHGLRALGAGETVEVDLPVDWLGIGEVRLAEFDLDVVSVTLIKAGEEQPVGPSSETWVTAGALRARVRTDHGTLEAPLEVEAGQQLAFDPAPWLPAALTLVQVPAGATVRLSVEGAGGEIVEREEVFDPDDGAVDPATGVRIAPPRKVDSLIGGTGGLFVSHPVLGSDASSFAVLAGAVNATTFDWRALSGVSTVQESFDRWRQANDPAPKRATRTRVLGIGAGILAAASVGLIAGAAAADADVDAARQEGLGVVDDGGSDEELRSSWTWNQSSANTRDALLVIGGVAGGLGVTGLTFTIVSAAHRPELDLSDWDRDPAAD